jgi:hypothetical protein
MNSVSCKATARERRWVAPTAIVSAPDAADSPAHNKEEQIFRVCAGTEHEQTQLAERVHSQLRKRQVSPYGLLSGSYQGSLSQVRQPFSTKV